MLGDAVPQGGGTGTATVRVEILLPAEPTQISVDPDRILLDSNPTNNHWKPDVRWRLTPLYTQLEETDVTNAYDRWNVIVGPWLYGSAYNDPWYTRSPLAGFKATVYRTQEFMAGAFVAYRSNDRNVVAGVECFVGPRAAAQHPNRRERGKKPGHARGPMRPAAERSFMAGISCFRAARLYLPPFEYVETFARGPEPLPARSA